MRHPNCLSLPQLYKEKGYVRLLLSVAVFHRCANCLSLPQLFKEKGYVTVGLGKIFHDQACGTDRQ